jgi:hypothetical protein
MRLPLDVCAGRALDEIYQRLAGGVDLVVMAAVGKRQEF